MITELILGFLIGLATGFVFFGIIDLSKSKFVPITIDPDHTHVYGPWYRYLDSWQRQDCTICNHIRERRIPQDINIGR